MRTAAFSLILLAACSPSPGVLTAAPELGGSVKNSLGMKLVYIPPGKFMMGSPESEPGREAQEVQHEVELTKVFYLGMHEVTVGQFKAFVNDTKYVTDGERDGKGAYGINEAGKIEEMHAKFTWKSPGFEQTDDHPVVDVSWNDAKAFCLNFRAYYHAAWLVGDGRAKDIKITADYDDSNLADVQTALYKTRKGVETIVDKLNEKFGKKVVFLVPVGDATMKLREMIQDGKDPGVKKQSELWMDVMPPPGPHVMALSGYCHFAAIYRRSPVGLKISRFKELTDEQHAILQKLAWETVSKYAYAGVAR